MAPPTVLLVAESGGAGGIGRYCMDLAGMLGARASVVCLCEIDCAAAGGCWLSRQCTDRGLSLDRVPMPPKSWRVGFSGLAHLWRSGGQPLVHVNGRRGNSLAALARVTLPGFRYVTTAHGVLGLHGRRNALYRFVDLAAGWLASAVISVSADTGRRLVRAGISRRKLFVIPNALADADMIALTDVAGQRRACDESARARIGFLGRLSPEKGTRELLKTAQMLHAAGLRATFSIAGDGPDREWFLAATRDMRDDGFLRFVGTVDDVAAFLTDIDIVLVPSHNEGMPYAVLEAMAAGCAVVAFRVGGIPEVASHPSAGILVAPRDVDALAAALVRLSGSPSLAFSIGQAASGLMQEQFAMRDRLPILLRAYERCVGETDAVEGQCGEECGE